MDSRPLTDTLTVAPQIEPEDMATLAAAGCRTVIGNRPDDEVAAHLSSARMAEAAAAAGMRFHYLPFSPGGITPALVTDFGRALDEAEGPVLAYCRSGTRSTMLWALSQAGRMPVDEILSTAAGAGYDVSQLVPMLRR